MQYYKSENDDIPTTTEEWKSNFNEDIFNGIEDDTITMKNEVKEEEIASRNKKDKILPECIFVCRNNQILMGLYLHGLVWNKHLSHC